MSRLEVQVFRTQRRDPSGASVDVLQVTARNAQGRSVTLGSCAVILPLGLLVFSDPPQLDYPFALATGAQCSDFIECRLLAEQAREAGYPGRVRVQALFREVAPATARMDRLVGARVAEHRSDPFVFVSAGWE